MWLFKFNNCYWTFIMAAQQVICLSLLLMLCSLINLSDESSTCELNNISVLQEYYGYEKCEYKSGKHLKCRILYYANSTSTFQLELCGDVEINPGPTKTETEPTHPSTSNVSKPISYSRTELLQLNKYNHQTAPKLPCELWTHLQNLGITYRCRLPRRKEVVVANPEV